MTLTIEIDERKDCVVLRLASSEGRGPLEVDLLESETVETALAERAARGDRRLILDVRDISYMHSRAFWALVAAGERLLRDGGRLVLSQPSSYLRRLVELTSAAEVLELAPTLEDALRLMDPGSGPE